MSQADEVARLVEAVSGLEQAIVGIAAILEGHGEMLARLLEAAEEKPPEETVTHQLLRALIGRLDQQQGTRIRAKARGQHMGRPPKLNPAQQAEARRRRAEGATLKELAKSYNVAIATISRLRA